MKEELGLGNLAEPAVPVDLEAILQKDPAIHQLTLQMSQAIEQAHANVLQYSASFSRQQTLVALNQSFPYEVCCSSFVFPVVW